MDHSSQRFYVRQSEALPPIKSPLSGAHLRAQSPTSFPITAVAIIGILATAFLLVSYYIFVIKCCLNWHRIDLLRRFSASRARSEENPSAVYPPAAALERLGLDDAAIRSIPILKFEKGNSDRDCKAQTKSLECAVCLNEFQEEERLRVIPNCGHVFHVDCIDVWLQNNANCPLCRASVSADARNYLNQILSRSTHSSEREDEDYVVIEIGSSPPPPSTEVNPSSSRIGEASGSGEFTTISPSTKKFGQRKKGKHLSRVSSMGDECVDLSSRPRDVVKQTVIRRSFSMDSAADSQFYQAVQDAMIRRGSDKMVDVSEVVCSGGEDSCSSSSNGNRVKRSFFSFGQGRSSSRSAVQPVALEPL